MSLKLTFITLGRQFKLAALATSSEKRPLFVKEKLATYFHVFFWSTMEQEEETGLKLLGLWKPEGKPCEQNYF